LAQCLLFCFATDGLLATFSGLNASKLVPTVVSAYPDIAFVTQWMIPFVLVVFGALELVG
jgi:hypothetical protein